MRTVEKQIKINGNKRKFYYEQFNNYIEYMNIVESRDNKNRENDLESNCEDRSWCGVNSYSEAKDLLVNGWKEKVEELKMAVKSQVALCDTKQVVRNFSDVVGFMPIVPNAIMGLPNCMLNNRMERKKAKVIKFLIGMNRGCHYSSKEIIEKMSKIIAKIYLLEKSGYRCRLEIFGSFNQEHDSKTLVCHSVLIKSENQLFDLQRICFPIGHSAMQRVYGFAWENGLPLDYSEYHSGGMGRAIQYWSENSRNAILDAVNENGEKVIYLSVDSDINEIFGKGGEIDG